MRAEYLADLELQISYACEHLNTVLCGFRCCNVADCHMLIHSGDYANPVATVQHKTPEAREQVFVAAMWQIAIC